MTLFYKPHKYCVDPLPLDSMFNLSGLSLSWKMDCSRNVANCSTTVALRRPSIQLSTLPEGHSAYKPSPSDADYCSVEVQKIHIPEALMLLACYSHVDIRLQVYQGEMSVAVTAPLFYHHSEDELNYAARIMYRGVIQSGLRAEINFIDEDEKALQWLLSSAMPHLIKSQF